MLLSELLKNCPVVKLRGSGSVIITDLCFDSRKVRPGCAFFALGGQVHDGHAFVADAVARGAVAVVSEHDCALPEEVAGVVVANSRKAMAGMAQNFFGDPTQDMAVVGITGTNGKTTISYLLESILEHAGMSPAVVGTVNYRYAGKLLPAPHTTPEAPDLLARIASFKEQGARSLALEVSSHALDQFRADGIHFRVGVFTNLTPEHLDYHRDMERYFASKCRLFRELLAAEGGRSVVNIDDPYGARLVPLVPGVLTCGRRQDADIRPVSLAMTLKGLHGRIMTPLGEVQVATRLLGEYNVENLLCSIGAAVALGLPVQTIEEGLAAAPNIPGRLERIENNRGAVILVDYAHTGDALKRVLEAMKSLRPRRLVTVFGCGGDRDRSKRAVMGNVAARLSDVTVATSDNPRTEDPLDILADIRQGLSRVYPREWSMDQACAGQGRGYLVIPDRREAIRFAVSVLNPGDLLLVAGKGHEDYQILGTQKIHFDDREEIRTALAAGGTP
jgi:UDP-N-acetylmuramoyl-L-alanyl-D-glutamate--2,6-diaminopimelate ligase